MKSIARVALVCLLIAATPAPATVSQSFGDRAARVQQRIVADASANRFAAGQQTLLEADLRAARVAYEQHNPQAAAMLDVIERELAVVDFSLDRANNGQSIVVHVGERVSVAMRDDNAYDLQLSDAQALMRARGVMFVRGVQGVYSATKPATVEITLTPMGGSGGTAVSFTVVILPNR